MQETTHPWPNFFIAGAPKAGTTSLYHYLSQHPQIYLSPVKEPCYFASEVRSEHFSREFESTAQRSGRQLRTYLDGPMTDGDPGGIVTNWEDYLRLFKNVDGEIAVGEASVCYLWSPTAASNIRSRIPEAKIVIILRDPAERAYSQYLHYAANGLVRRSFREHIKQSARNTRREFNTLYPFLEYGLYCRQVRAYLEVFPRAHIRVYLYEEAWKDPLAFLKAIFEYLNVDSEFRADVSRRTLQRRAPRSLTSHYVLRKSGIAPRLKALAPRTIWNGIRTLLFRSPGSLRMDSADRSYLCDFYRDDVAKLSSLLDRDLGSWLK
ncbi:MAG: sulfotransferase [Acidobacteriia bacterium]|nr:sulfotransferase [Terriglobia bacterium]